jgi:hypothetical protein
MDLYRIFKPVIYISRIFCLAPFAVIEDSRYTKYKLSKFWLLYSIFGMCLSSLFVINIFWIHLSFSGPLIVSAISIVISTATCVASIVSQVLCLCNAKNVVRILDHVYVLDSEHDGEHISYYRLYKVLITLIIYNVVSFVVPNIISFAIMNTNSVYILEIVYFSSVYFICDAVLFISDIQFIHFVLLLKYRFSVLNDSVINSTVSSLSKTSLNHTIKPPAFDNDTTSSTSAFRTSTPVLKSSLSKVYRHHNALCDISESVNRAYCIQILHGVTVKCIQVLLTAYSLSTELLRANYLKYYSSFNFAVMSSFVWVLVIAGKITQLVVVCNCASREVSQIHLCLYVAHAC